MEYVTKRLNDTINITGIVNLHFFEFSIEEFSAAGYKIENVSLDLHNSDFEGNIVTEYEKRFSDLGQPIYRLEANKNKQ